MIYKNKFVIKPSKKIVLTFDKFFQPAITQKDENLAIENIAVETYNFLTEDGSLKNGYGFKDLTVKRSNIDYVVKSSESEIKGIWTARWLNNANQNVEDYLFYTLDDNKMYYLDLSVPQYTFCMENSFSDIPSMTKVRQNLTLEAFAFTSSDGLVLLNQSTENLYENVPSVMDACYQYNMMFAITKETRNALIYSSQLDVTAWTNQNTYRIDFTDERGRLIKIMSFNDNLYVFREFGITKVTPYSVSTNFSVEHLYQSSSYIYPETIAICQDNVIFMTKEGLYSFNGSKVKKLDFQILSKVEKLSTSKPAGIGFNGKYFLACKMEFSEGVVGCESEEGYVNNAVIIFDILKENVEVVRGVDVKKFAELNSVNLSRLCAIFRGTNKHRIGEFVNDGQVFGSRFESLWKSAYSDFGYTNKLKYVSQIQLISLADCNFVVETDEETKEYNLKGSNKVQRIKTDVKGRNLRFIFRSFSAQQKISKPEISMTVYQ